MSLTLFRRTRRVACALTLLATTLGLFAGGIGAPAPLVYPRIDLTNGRILRQVEIHARNADTQKVFLLADGTAMFIPLALFPAAVQTAIQQDVPASGGTVSVVPSPEPVQVPSQPAPMIVQVAPAPAAPSEEQVVAAHRRLALAYAVRYFRYEYQVGSGYVRVDSVDCDATPTRPVSGRVGRYETAGTAYLEYFDSAGLSAGRAKCRFWVQTEEDPDQPLRVVRFEHRN